MMHHDVGVQRWIVEVFGTTWANKGHRAKAGFWMGHVGRRASITEIGKTCLNRGKKPPGGWGRRKQGLSEGRAAGCHVAICSNGVFSKPQAGGEGDARSDSPPVTLSRPRRCIHVNRRSLPLCDRPSLPLQGASPEVEVDTW
jgi:hypothetical protein